MPSQMPMPCPWDQQNYQGQRLNEDDHMKGRLCHCPYDDGKQFSFGVQDQNGAGQANWKPCLFLQDSKTFSSSWMSIKTSWQMAWRTDHSSSPMELKSSVLVASDICWWVQGQTLHLWKDIALIIPAWISNYIHYNVWDEITYPFLNFNGCTVEV